ncbi:MAG: SufD family Fe-S cluster assembly protein [Firmicutes bacterium]|nr:SufD family Fe-S cluster assembly protein [Bacillota bacterium]
MNKLLVSDIIDLNNGNYKLACQSTKLIIRINGEVNIYFNNEVLEYLDIYLNDNSILNIYKFNNKKENNLIINIYQNNNSKLNYNEAFINERNNKLIINNHINGNDNESLINIRNISDKNNSEIIINVEVAKNTINNIALEDLKGINNGGFIHIEPNIVCLSNDVSANHLTTIGSVDNASIDYLMSKGISLENAKKILLKGFIYSNMDEYVKKNFGGEDNV